MKAKLLWTALALITTFNGCAQKGNKASAPNREFVPGTNLVGKSRDDKEYIREWNLFTTVGDYRSVGKTGAKWDDKAIAALRAYAEIRTKTADQQRLEELMDIIRTNCNAAVAAGCDDSLIRYLHTRYTITDADDMSSAALAEEYRKVAVAMEKTGYSPLRKAYVYMRGGKTLKSSLGELTNSPPALRDFWMGAVDHLNEALQDKSLPTREANDLSREVLELCEKASPANDYFGERIFPTMEKHWASNSFVPLLKGQYYSEKAWAARGGGFADTVTKKGWNGFEKNLDLAEAALNTAWQLDKSNAVIATEMITVCIGKGYPRGEMEKWFERAMNIDPNCYEAAYRKGLYLDPRWFGSVEEKMKFARKCVNSTKWGGRVPLILADAHSDLAELEAEFDKSKSVTYWRRPGVWEDLRSSYDKCLSLNPKDLLARHRYARDARACGEFKTLLEQITILGKDTDKHYFGGPQEFDEMLRVAREKTGAL
jgi:hypothetical protein